MHDSLFRDQPWFRTGALASDMPAGRGTVGMLDQREANLFRDLARRAWTGHGTIIDAGSFLGKSAVCFAAGLRQNPAFEPGRHHIHCFDDFLCRDNGTIRQIERGFGERIALGDGTRRFFDRQVHGCADLLRIYDQDFHRVAWQPEPIEILMVDIAKTVSLGRKVVATFFPQLIPGQSLVAHQDYHHIWLPHIHVVMEYLHDSFELVAPRVDCTAVFAMTAPMDPKRLQRCIDYDFSEQEQHDLMANAIERVPEQDRAMLELARLYLESKEHEAEPLLARLDLVCERYRDRGAPSFESEAASLTSHLMHEAVRQARQHGNHLAALARVDELLNRSPESRHAHMLRVGILLDLDRMHEAKHAAETLLALPVQELGNRLEIAQVLHGVGHHQRAEQALIDDLMAHGPSLANPGDYFDLLCSIWEQQQPNAAHESHCQQLVERLTAALPDSPEVPALAARSAFLRGDLPAAQQALQTALDMRLDPARADSLLAPLGMTAAEFVRR